MSEPHPADLAVQVQPLVKPWYESKTLAVNLAIIAAWVITAVASSAGVFALTPAVVGILGIASGAINLGLRLVTNSAVAGTPAAIAHLEAPS